MTGRGLLLAVLVALPEPARAAAGPEVGTPPSPVPGASSPTAAPAEAAAEAWAARADPARLAAALESWRSEAARHPEDPALELRLARAEAFRALAATGPAERRAAHDASARAAERALTMLAPAFGAALARGTLPAEAAPLVPAAGAEALYRLAVGRLGVAQATGPSALLVVKEHALPLLERAAALDETVDRGGPLRELGAWAAALPVAAGGGVAAARARFDRARQLFPAEPWRRVLEARSLAVLLQDGAAFDRLLGEVLALAEPDPAWAPELALARRRARELLDKRASLF